MQSIRFFRRSSVAFIVVCDNFADTYVKAKPNLKMRSIRSNYAEERGLSLGDVTFFYEGVMINDSDTLSTLGVKDGDQLIVMIDD